MTKEHEIMRTDEIARQIRAYKRMREELDQLIEQLTDDVKQYMTENGLEELAGNESKITWKPCKAKTFDSRNFCNEHPDLAAQYTHETVTRRFLVL